MASAAAKKLKNHLWYLGPEMVWLSLFSNKVVNAEKKFIVKSMIAQGSDWSVRGIKYLASGTEQVKQKALHELIALSTHAALLSV